MLYQKSDDIVENETTNKKLKFKEEIVVDIDDNEIKMQLDAIQSSNVLTPATNASVNKNDDEAPTPNLNIEKRINYDVHPLDEDKGEFLTVTRSGRHVWKPKWVEALIQ